MLDFDIPRRTLLKGGALTIGFALAGSLPAALAQAEPAALGPPGKTVALTDVDTYLAIARDGSVTVFTGKVDLGTGVQTALMQMVADELDVAPARIRMVMGDSALTPDQGPTSGSNAVQIAGMQLRQASATARQALLAMAADRLKLPAGQLATVNGSVVDSASRQRVGYGELIGDRQFALKLDPKAPAKDPADHRVVGQSVARLDIPPKVMGRFEYMQDFRRPGMLHGRVVRPPGMGATLLAVDEGSLAAFGPNVKLVRQGNFLGVVAPTEWTAIKAARALKVSWSTWSELPEQAKLWDHVRATKSVKDEITSKVGDAPDTIAQAPRVLKATYDFPIHTHGSIGPSCAVAEFSDGRLTCWTASQATHNLRKQLARMMSLPPENVRTIYLEGAGCYGRNGHEDAAGDAALLARALGRPVRVQWMRADEHGWDPKGPPTLIDLKAAIDAQGRLVAWQGEFFVPDGVTGSTVPLVPADLADLPHEPAMAPGGVTANSSLSYQFPNVLTVAHRLADTPFKPSWIRSPGRLQNCFANECFLDEITTAIGADPIDYRIAQLAPANVRGIEVLQRLARLSGWHKRSGRAAQTQGEVAVGRGVAFIHYDLSRAFVGMVAEVEVNRKTGAIRAQRFFVTHDCGQVINPDGIRSQIEGNVIQTLSRTLKEELTFDRSTVTSRDWASYPILTFPEVPEIVIELIDRPNEKPLGAGEPSAATVTAAVANAVHDAVGLRLRSVPFRADRVLAAMRAQASPAAA
jgi:CO/xanthine dehydrogenase Mo-binding subunit